ncbi:MAG: Na/Pi cotransporter family protein [Kiritimatiellia bacterium]|nr:Na/Pi cotransporter family protein [Kiritimatiellia bacterium]
MDTATVVDIASGVVGGLAIFLLGMKNMSEGMQAIAGSRLRKMIGLATNNRFLACGAGAIVTSIIQSSSVTTVMLVGFVNAGIMTLLQAIGVILGADIGTTITGWIVSLNVAKYGLPILGVSGLLYLFTQRERLRYAAMAMMGVGMVFFGLQLMKHGLEPLRHSEDFIAWFSRFEPKSLLGVIKCVSVGALVTAVVQSSSATVAITMTLASTGVIGFDTAVALVLGENIGTTITAYLSSLGASTNAKRVAYAHVLIKVIGVSIAIMVFSFYMDLLNELLSDDLDIKKRIAFSHTLFNICLVCMFLPLRNPLAALLLRLVPDKPHKETRHLTFLDVRLLDTPAFGIQQSFDEICKMGEGVQKMLGWIKALTQSSDRQEDLERKVFHREEILDIMQKEIVEFLGHMLSAGSVPHDVMAQARRQLRMADEYESISDYCAAILKMDLRLRQSGCKFMEDGVRDMNLLHDRVVGYIRIINEAVSAENTDILIRARSEGDIVTHMMKDYRRAHFERIEKEPITPLCNVVYVDMLQCYRKIKDHALNIAEALAGEK